MPKRLSVYGNFLLTCKSPNHPAFSSYPTLLFSTFLLFGHFQNITEWWRKMLVKEFSVFQVILSLFFFFILFFCRTSHQVTFFCPFRTREAFMVPYWATKFQLQRPLLTSLLECAQPLRHALLQLHKIYYSQPRQLFPWRVFHAAIFL